MSREESGRNAKRVGLPQPSPTMSKQESAWKREALRLRENHRNDSAAVAAFVELFERDLAESTPVLCLALHHVAMRFHSHAGKKTLKRMHRAELEDLPEAIFPKDRIPKRI
jgi:hypothetical protein